MKYLRHSSLLVVLLTMFSLGALAQEDAEFRMEVGGGLGTSFYLGDVNTRFYRNAGVAVGGVWRCLFDHRNALKASLAYGGVKGKSDISIDYYPQDVGSKTPSTSPLQYSFSSYVVDLSCMYEINFWPYGYYQDFMGYKRITPFLQLGMGFTYMGQPKALTANIPMGAGVKYRLGKRLNVAFDWTIHFSLSDKIDGLDAPLGIKGQGIKNKDSYQTTMITLTYNFSPICPNCNKD